MKSVIIVNLLLLSVSLVFSEEYAKHGKIDEDHYKGGHNDKYDHEAILGDDDEVEEFAHLSPDEAKAKLTLLVDKMDLDQNGFVDVDELTKWIAKSFQHLNKEEAADKLMEEDENGDGVLSWEEYLQAAFGMSVEEIEIYKERDIDTPEAKEIMVKSLDYDKLKFEAADTDKSKTLSDEEYAAFIHPYDYEVMSDLETDRVLSEMDKDGDGSVSWEEYTTNPEEEEDKIAEKENFKYNDKNGDGKMDRSDVKHWVAPNNEEIAGEETQHLMSETDADKDGQLSKEEILNQHELWVGSEATDYGNYLHEEL